MAKLEPTLLLDVNPVVSLLSGRASLVSLVLRRYGGRCFQRELVLWPGIFNRTRSYSCAFMRGDDWLTIGRL